MVESRISNIEFFPSSHDAALLIQFVEDTTAVRCSFLSLQDLKTTRMEWHYNRGNNQITRLLVSTLGMDTNFVVGDQLFGINCVTGGKILGNLL